MGTQSKHSVLVVEDEAFLRRMICAALEMKGLTVLQACNGQEALEQLSRHHVDLLLTDWNMPAMCGRELLAEVRGGALCPKLPIIVVSGATMPDDSGAEQGGVSQWVKKPFRVGDLQAMVMTTIENAQT